jgi:hypothetical protein
MIVRRRYWHLANNRGNATIWSLSDDTVAKRIFVSWHATLIQELDALRKIDSNGALVGF